MSRMSWAVVALLGFVFLPTTALAQSTIAGQVVDNTGGVLPGVTVEATSPALIEGTRTGVTGGQGRYTIVNLEPGVYTVLFSLPGFGSVAREELTLPSDFTATVDVTMTVGNLEETVVVSGQSPVVDIQQSERTQVLTRDVLDSIPTGRNTWTQAAMLAGVRMTGTDVGGSQYVSDLLLETHGASALHSTYQVDGMKVNTMLNDGRDQNYYQDQSNQEVSVQTSGGNAEVSSGGVLLNMIPKDGGNTFSGTAYGGGSSGAWQSDNLTDRLQNLGVSSVDTIRRIFDYNATLGGPIIRDRLWFFHSLRYWGVWDPPASTYLDDGSIFSPERNITSPILRITYQASQSNKISVHFDRQAKSSGPTLTASYPAVVNSIGSDPETARNWQDSRTPYGVASVKWTSTPSNRVLIEAGYVSSFTYVLVKPPNGVTVDVGDSLGLSPLEQTTLWYSRVQKRNLSTNQTWNATAGQRWKPSRNTATVSLSYVTGEHNVKFGLQNSFGRNERFYGYETNGHLLRVNYVNAVGPGGDTILQPVSAIAANYPSYQNPRLNYDLGLYAQDSWTLDRVTLNYGMRFEWVNAKVGEQFAAAGRFAPARYFPEVENVPNWFDVRPRFGLAYDMFGTGRTALKFSIGTYSTPQGTGFAERFNPFNPNATVTLPWTDADVGGGVLPTNGDDIVQDNELDFNQVPANFGLRALDRFDPDITREYNLEVALSVQHELMDNVSASVGWYHRRFSNQYSDNNLLRSRDHFREIEVVSPYNGEVFPVYDFIDSASRGLVDTLVTNAGEDRAESYHGFEVALEARLPGGGTILTSSTTQRIVTKSCDEGEDDPNLFRFCDRGNLPSMYNSVPYRSDFKFAFTHPLPYDLNVSMGYNDLPGRTFGDLVLIDELLPVNWLITRGTTYADGTPVIPDMVSPSITVPLAPAGTERFLPRLRQLDVGVKKIFQTGRMTYEASFEVFNLLNANSWDSERSANFGTSSYAVPSRILLGRLPRMSITARW